MLNMVRLAESLCGFKIENSVANGDLPMRNECSKCDNTGRIWVFRRTAEEYQNRILIPALTFRYLEECEGNKVCLKFWRRFEEDHSIPCKCSNDLI